MFFRLSFRNVRKSFSDYTLYFLTLTFAVCIFYVFNSIEAQRAMLTVSSSMSKSIQTIVKLMNGVSVFVSFILGFLIVYANNFLIRRRKREFGIYMTLGMQKSKISRILMTETLIIGVFSLGAGLLAGFFLSQGFSVITASLFDVNMAGFKFIFSVSALWKTVIYFGIMFIVAIVINAVILSKYKLLDLINASRQNEKQRVRKTGVTVLLTVLAIACIGAAYGMVLKFGITEFDYKIIIEMSLGAAGTFLLFAALSGILPGLVKANERFYFKGLNMFTARQLSSRITTAFVSMSFICLMLFCTICIFSTGLGATSVLNRGYQDAAPVDITVTFSGSPVDIRTALAEHGIDVGSYADGAVEYNLYIKDSFTPPLGDIFKSIIDEIPEDKRGELDKGAFLRPMYFTTLSEYNSVMAYMNKPGLSLKANEAALLTQYAWVDADYQEFLDKYINEVKTISLGSVSYAVYPELVATGIANGNNSLLTLILPDEAAINATVFERALIFNCKGDSVAVQERFMSVFGEKQGDILKEAGSGSLGAVSRSQMQAQEGGSKAIISFMGIYVGIVFLMASAAVLALQQVSEAADNRQRYAILRKIGAGDRLLGRTIFRQVAVYFAIPLIVACIHSVIGIKVANDAVRLMGSLNAVSNIIITAVLILLVYGAYFLATFFGSKKIILRNDRNMNAAMF
jgi:putative ABC transport system permease protein